MTEVLGTVALIAGGYALYKTIKRELSNMAFNKQPAYATARKRTVDPAYTRLVQDPVTGKYRPTSNY
ncbi:hypothetical protein [Pseudovibrio sp. Tun.PSC04-5.I4]|uniref:hypothetical protein n=1 Tax=Pseudovibrio sp. Tun.PSC04-5.I4 TaxID=1798213 RepID=UPI00088C0E9F|nr:hypothetical protein [Pseudovibrio sp. Tun.PSC04-5.I4]SDQ81141.1 hypothetical protein SAMN04515695_1491 [Pseudovibrio sp. Tun.PSC04-5.I4]